MKVRALASISGPMGRKTVGEEFVVNAAEAKDLVERKLVVVVEDAPVVDSPKQGKSPKQPKAEP
ncbi:hypothetical protein ACIPL1_30540 [Pseudomonas sp. NPDC090202]|uniref:hypothetical protein n=1 Tax=Pseudomonas sp. NPDC090202 TaxID=3364476 RepID=UPI0038227486